MLKHWLAEIFFNKSFEHQNPKMVSGGIERQEGKRDEACISIGHSAAAEVLNEKIEPDDENESQIK